MLASGMRLARLLVVAVAAGVWMTAAACSSDDSTATGDAGATDARTDAPGSDAATDAPADAIDESAKDAGPQCNAIANAAPLVTPTIVNAARPAGAGGEIKDGTYFVTAVTYYLPGFDGGVSESWKQTYVVTTANKKAELASERNGKARTSATLGYTATAGGALTLTESCPGTKVDTDEYTASGNEIRVIVPSDERVLTLTKQ
jgi:hypothetical protein